MFMRAQNHLWIDPSYPYDIDGYCGIVRNPVPEAKLWAMAGPYGMVVWLTIFASLLFTTLLYALALRKGAGYSSLAIFGLALKQSVNLEVSSW